ncbi:phospholipase A2 [Rhizohabitans arisaemae]|uniref:phospholipase A2 n=1 Tax=Rhizohabitans arisaemae TaxID=2720610 RepID=UPI0024B107EF|nr:phospholipase A2 [Rhizohabitans arisaemae]
MRRLNIVAAAIATTLPLIAVYPAEASTATTTVTPPDQAAGPGQYHSENKSFEFSEIDVAAGLIGRKHSVSAVTGGMAQPRSLPASRTDLSAFGPGWEVEILGGLTGRKLETQSGAVLVTELGSGIQVRYVFKSGDSLPGGGGVNRYEAEDGSTLTETTRPDAGVMRTTIVETVAGDLSATEPGDDTFTDASGNPIAAADLNQTYTWEQAGVSGDMWRVTGIGTKAFDVSTVKYDAQGRVASVHEPGVGEAPKVTLEFAYATSTTAVGGTFGDYAGRLKKITAASGAGAPETVAAYGYDVAGLLRSVTDPGDGGLSSTYSYDGVGRLTAFDSHQSGGWQLAYAGQSALPTATSTSATRWGDASDTPPPDLNPTPPQQSPGPVAGPMAYPSSCNRAHHWMYYSRSGCSAWAAHYGWHRPYWRQLPSRRWVVGIFNDHCTSAPDRPFGFDFRPACDMHDYGYGVIGNSWKTWYYPYHLDRSRKGEVDTLFYTTLRDWTCNAYPWYKRGLCRNTALTYHAAVRARGNPKNGADATRP